MTEPRVTLVLGAGGVTGGGYEYGVLRALAERSGWQPSGARAFIGTSAGAWVAAFLAAGRRVEEIPSAAGPATPSGSTVRRAAGRVATGLLGDASGLYTPDWRIPRLSPFSWLRPASLAAESGVFSGEGMARRLRAQFPDAETAGWPHPNLRIVAWDTRRRRRAVFGRSDAPKATIVEAVTASSAIPGVFRPVVIDGVPYLDGGVASTTNLDLAEEFVDSVDLVLCLTPMASDRSSGGIPAGPRFGGYALTETLGWVARRQVERESARLRARHPNLDLLVFRPDAADRQVMGDNPMDGRRREPVREQAYKSGLAMLERAEVRAVLARHGL